MLYVDSSALMKHYQNERGTDAFDERLRAEFDNSRHVFTSVLSYAEIHAIVARRVREKLVSAGEARPFKTDLTPTGCWDIPQWSLIRTF